MGTTEQENKNVCTTTHSFGQSVRTTLTLKSVGEGVRLKSIKSSILWYS